MSDVPYEILDSALKEATIARDGVVAKNIEAVASGKPANHSLHFRKKKDIRWTIMVRARNVGQDLRMYKSWLHSPEATHDIDPESLRHYHSFTCPSKPQSWIDPTMGGRQVLNPSGIYPMHHEKKGKNNGWPEQEEVECDSSLTYDRLTRKFTFNWVYLKTPPERSGQDLENQEVSFDPLCHLNPGEGSSSNTTLSTTPIHHICSIDPGVNAFLTGYSPTKGGFEIGGARRPLPLGQNPPPTIPHNARRRHRNIGRPQKPVLTDSDHIFRLGMFLDKLISKTATAPKSKRANMRRAQGRARDRIKWLIKEVHHKAAHFLTTEFDVIALPVFNAGNMARRIDRRINSEVVRKMLTWSHFRFRQFLIQKAEQRGKLVIHPLESYTTKTCCRCGRINNSVGGSRVFLCREDRGGCGLRISRDLNGAVGILLRTFFEGFLGY